MTRPIRVAVEKINAPHAEMSTAGVIIAVSTANALAGASSRVSQSTASFYSRRRRDVPNGQGLKFKARGAFRRQCKTAKATSSKPELRMPINPVGFELGAEGAPGFELGLLAVGKLGAEGAKRARVRER
jgi:hypothetical protein